jgi:hypothetical protein
MQVFSSNFNSPLIISSYYSVSMFLFFVYCIFRMVDAAARHTECLIIICHNLQAGFWTVIKKRVEISVRYEMTEENCFLGCDNVKTYRSLSTFWNNLFCPVFHLLYSGM